ncbi:hypothetical protein ALC53_10715 [Atta colombica]|uniref:Uncharacterized protein n=1 Tax=Atta colombica TaxID=520822 RepID=A0A151I054_9HYME|nr:hypothetical protein ALC53_10715 [Atta colombica]
MPLYLEKNKDLNIFLWLNVKNLYFSVRAKLDAVIRAYVSLRRGMEDPGAGKNARGQEASDDIATPEAP